MDVTHSYLENTGVNRHETFTFRLCVPKSRLVEQFEEWDSGSISLSEPATFNTGLLEGIPNSFELIVNGFSVPEIALFVTPQLTQKRSFGIRITDIKLSLLEGVVVVYTADMQIGPRQPFGSTSSNLTGYDTYYTCSNSKDVQNIKWTDSVDQLKLDITVTQLSKLKYKISETVPTYTLPIMENEPKCMDLSKYYLSSHLSDASIKCEEETFPVHLMVLSESSPVFAKMFEHKTKEKEERCVEIEDAQLDAVREMLRYFYTQTVNDLNVFAFQLFELADRYLVESLKELCTNFLVNNVNVGNVTEMYCFGLKHGVQIITKAAEDFLIKNRKDLIKSFHGLQSFLKNVPIPISEHIFKLIMGG